MTQFHTLSCKTKDNKTINYINDIFELTTEQEKQLQKYISSLLLSQLKNKEYSLKLTPEQQTEVRKFHDYIKTNINKFILKPSIQTNYWHNDVIFDNHATIRFENRYLQSKCNSKNKKEFDPEELYSLNIYTKITPKKASHYRCYKQHNENYIKSRAKVNIESNYDGEHDMLNLVFTLIYTN